MASNQSVLEQMLQAALSGGGLREKEGGPSGSAQGGPGNLGDILGSLLGSAVGGSGAATGRPAPGGAGGLGDILGSILGGQATAGDDVGGVESYRGAPGSERMPADPGSSGGSRQQQAEMPQQAGMNDLMRYGGLAVIGVLAYQAYKRHQAKQGSEQKDGAVALAPPPDSGFHPGTTPGGADALSGIFAKAMVAATQADGVIDEDEQRRLAGRLDQIGMSSADRRAVIEQLTTPVDPREIVNAATSPELGLQIYAASVLAVSVDTPAERSYLDQLAGSLGIDPGLKAQVEQTLRRA